MSKYVGRNLHKGERLVFQAKIHWACLIPHIILIPFFIGFITIIPVIIRMCTTELGITNKRVIGKIGWINTKSMDSPLNKIDNASVSSGLFGKLLGYGDVDILTSSDDYRYKGIARPEAFKAALMRQVDQYGEDQIKKQATELAQAIKS